MGKIKNKILNMTSNPIVIREIKQTFRKPRIFWIFMVYLFALSAIAFYIFGMISNISGDYDPGAATAVYFVILGMQMFIMTFTVPIITASAITGEKERQTFDLLIITKTSMHDIIVGKLLSSLMIIAIMVALSLPIYAVIFYYGGVSVIQFIFNIIYLMSYVAMIGSLGILFSTIMKKSTAASTATISFIFATVIGTWMLFGMIYGVFSIISYTFNIEIWRVVGVLFIFNPIISFISMVDNQLGSTVSWDIIEEIGFGLENKFIYCWHINIFLYLFLTHLMIKAAAKKISPLKKK